MAILGNPITTAAFITDQFIGNGSQTQYTMSVAPAGTTSILVSVSGVLQNVDSYAVNGLTLTFSAAPPANATISVRYLGVPASGIVNTAYRTVTEFTATAGQTSFSVPSYTVGFINVYRNGARLGSDDFTATSGTTVVLAAGATVGDLITTESFYVSSVLNAIPATAGAVNSTFIADNAVVASKIADSSVTQNKIANGAVVQSKLASGVAGTGPAFSAYQSSVQTIPATTNTKVQFQSEEFDTANCFDSTTNYRFTPNVAGYYSINGTITATSGGLVERQLFIYKNGSNFKGGFDSSAFATTMQAIIYLNGTTDYVELYLWSSAQSNLSASATYTYFQGALVRAA